MYEETWNISEEEFELLVTEDTTAQQTTHELVFFTETRDFLQDLLQKGCGKGAAMRELGVTSW